MAQVAAHMVDQQTMQLRVAVMERQLAAKEARLAALAGAAGGGGGAPGSGGGGLKAQYERVMGEMAAERDGLQKERMALMQVRVRALLLR